MVQPMEGPDPMWLVAGGICCFAIGLAVGYAIGKQEVQKMMMKNGPPTPNSAGLSSLSVNPISTRGVPGCLCVNLPHLPNCYWHTPSESAAELEAEYGISETRLPWS